MVARDKSEKKGGIGETVKTILYALLIAVVFRTFLFQPFWIPSGSMKPTLLVGDYLFISKYAYGYSRHSFPWSLAPFDGRVFASMPERGDVIVFKHPVNGSDYIKRLVGLPGDRIQMNQGVLHINGEAVRMERAGEFVEPARPGANLQCLERRPSDEGVECVKEAWRETLPGGVAHVALNADQNEFRGSDNTRVFEVPEDHYFFMGDNRDNSQDSRRASGVGFVPFENLVGRAEIIAVSWEDAIWQVWDWRFGRFLTLIE